MQNEQPGRPCDQTWTCHKAGFLPFFITHYLTAAITHKRGLNLPTATEAQTNSEQTHSFKILKHSKADWLVPNIDWLQKLKHLRRNAFARFQSPSMKAAMTQSLTPCLNHLALGACSAFLVLLSFARQVGMLAAGKLETRSGSFRLRLEGTVRFGVIMVPFSATGPAPCGA